MSDIILHHYPLSPFSEKVRMVLGYKGVPWKSVVIPTILPKPDVVALTGGYRRTPVMQIGADIYCDTALICDVLEHLYPTPPLYPDGIKGSARIIAEWADESLFWAAVAYGFQPKGAAVIFDKFTPEQASAFAEDRATMRAGAPRMHPSDAASTLRSYLRRIATMVDEHPFVQGQLPTLADFAIFHGLWFVKRIPAIAGIFDSTPAVGEWMQRMDAFSQRTNESLKGLMQKFTAEEALEVAKSSTPGASIFGREHEIFQDEHGLPLGSTVTVTPDDYAFDPVAGELIAATRTHYSLRRVDPRAGTVQVHFPRVGYVLRSAEQTPAKKPA